MTISAVLFDYHGVLTHVEQDAAESFGRSHGLPPGEFSRRMFSASSWHDYQIGRACREAWIADVARSLRPFWGRAAEDCLRTWMARPRRVNSSMVRLARALHGQGLLVSVLSNAPADFKDGITASAEINVNWTDTVLSGEVGLVKPDPAIFLLAADRLRRPPAACFLVDDTAVHVEAARQVGMRAHHFTGDLLALRQDFQALGLGA